VRRWRVAVVVGGQRQRMGSLGVPGAGSTKKVDAVASERSRVIAYMCVCMRAPNW
jgi:hypothetical protein